MRHAQVTFLREIGRLNASMSALHAIEGIDLSRCAEYWAGWNALRGAFAPGDPVLDVGSYRSPWPLFVAGRGAVSLLLDLDRTVSGQLAWARRAGASLQPILGSALEVPLRAGSLAVVTAISVVEHIAGDGDRRALAGLGQALRPGGAAFVSVPYARVAREGKWQRWYQHWYDDDAFANRLVAPSGLVIEEDGYLLGRRLGRFADVWYRLPARLRHALSWSHVPLFAAADLAGSRDDARVRWALLRKPSEGA